ncbi:MAG TPA: cytochrome c peroxidase [Pyrinomonadaceae bacterium]|nr:cytochrome c peroxidase [Pyrinomonadaceae bacterium]
MPKHAVAIMLLLLPVVAFAQLPRGIPQTLWRKRIPATNPMTAEKIALGEKLYFDKRLSASGSVSCAVCHDPANAFTDLDALSTGASGNQGTRNAPTILNAVFSELLFWDGRAGSLEEQAKQPLTNPAEMGMGSYDLVVARVSAIPEYQKTFRRVFGRDGVTIETIAKAIAAYERTQLSGNSKFDRFISGDQSAITEAQKRGWKLFSGKAKCIDCHSFSAASPFFTDFKFHNTGIGVAISNFDVLAGQVSRDVSAGALAHKSDFSELGRFLVTRQTADIAAFKTPTLRDVELTRPYMHNGAMKTLLDVVRFYKQGGEKNPYLDKKMQPLDLTEEEMSDLVEFLRSLTSDDVLKKVQSSQPQRRSN